MEQGQNLAAAVIDEASGLLRLQRLVGPEPIIRSGFVEVDPGRMSIHEDGVAPASPRLMRPSLERVISGVLREREGIISRVIGAKNHSGWFRHGGT